MPNFTLLGVSCSLLSYKWPKYGPDQIILKTNVMYVAKLLHEKSVKQIMNKLIINNRTGTKIYMKNPQKLTSKASLIRHIELYNSLPHDLKTLNPQRLKRRLKKMTVTFKD